MEGCGLACATLRSNRLAGFKRDRMRFEPSKELLGEIGDGQPEESANHPFEQEKIGFERGQFDLQIPLCDKFGFVYGRTQGFCQRLRLLLVEAAVLKLANKFVGVEGNRAHARSVTTKQPPEYETADRL